MSHRYLHLSTIAKALWSLQNMASEVCCRRSCCSGQLRFSRISPTRLWLHHRLYFQRAAVLYTSIFCKILFVGRDTKQPLHTLIWGLTSKLCMQVFAKETYCLSALIGNFINAMTPIMVICNGNSWILCS